MIVPCCFKQSSVLDKMSRCPDRIILCAHKDLNQGRGVIGSGKSRIMIWSLHIPWTVVAFMISIISTTEAIVPGVDSIEWVGSMTVLDSKSRDPTYLPYVL